MTENGTEYQADKVIKIVSIGVLRSNAITFNLHYPKKKITSIKDVEFLPGFLLFLKFSDNFYPDAVSSETSCEEKTYL